MDKKGLTMPDRAGNRGGARDPSSQKPFGLSQSFCGFEIVAKLYSKIYFVYFNNLKGASRINLHYRRLKAERGCQIVLINCVFEVLCQKCKLTIILLKVWKC